MQGRGKKEKMKPIGSGTRAGEIGCWTVDEDVLRVRMGWKAEGSVKGDE